MLTDTKLRTLKPRESAYRIADTNGLCIEVRPSSSKVWRYRYRYAGKPSIITMAEYPAMGLAEARTERDRLRALVKGGCNSSLVAKIEPAANVERVETTFGAIAAELLSKRAKEGLSPGSVKRERRPAPGDAFLP
ncbi:Arm DNA-binding domain-containing protein [Stenotrophomonas sp. VV52]|uniref:Arm DNA-binding domain-containing protein n=1 Tax=Stenotrophomonas sp. VV52 TaxID=2066958 RepID=UPI0031B5D600